MKSSEQIDKIVSLLYRILQDDYLSEAEEDELESWVTRSLNNQSVYEELINHEKLHTELKKMLRQDSKKLWQKVYSGIQNEKVRPVFYRRILRYAATFTFILLVIVGVYLLSVSKRNSPAVDLITANNADTVNMKVGSLFQSQKEQIITDTSSKTKAVSVRPSKKNIKKIRPQQSSLAIDSWVAHNTISTPPGKQYTAILPDGSTVYLQESSSITFPTVFADNQRLVSLKGRAYFDIIKNPVKPFRIVADRDTIDVISPRLFFSN